MRRREFITLFSSTVVAWPLTARAQQAATPVIGFLDSASPQESANLVAAFRVGLSETGYVEGRSLAIKYRWGQNEPARLPELAADLVRRRVAVIVTPGNISAALAATAATATIPIVFSSGADPVRVGLVASLNRPGGNITGISYMNVELGAKRLGILHELLPDAARFAMLVDPNSPLTPAIVADVQAAGSTIGRQIEVLSAGTNRDIDTVFASLAQKRLVALLLNPMPLFYDRRIQILTLAARYAMPTIYPAREWTELGGMMSYGSSFADQFRQTGIYTGRILKGENPADLPVLRATKFELVINLQTAKAIGIEVPPTLLARADEVIE